tara:strand:- start:2316 stop:2492 length:177 start_codon:yes stop_codon:yes gene_type:complete
MNKQLTRENVPHTKMIRFWCGGEIAVSSFHRMEHFNAIEQQQNANLILSEWIIQPQQN